MSARRDLFDNKIVPAKTVTRSGAAYCGYPVVIGDQDCGTTVAVRSPFLCDLKVRHRICQKCYGHLPGSFAPPDIGWSIGIMAAQSIGEHITQSALKSKHGTGREVGIQRLFEVGFR